MLCRAIFPAQVLVFRTYTVLDMVHRHRGVCGRKVGEANVTEKLGKGQRLL